MTLTSPSFGWYETMGIFGPWAGGVVASYTPGPVFGDAWWAFAVLGATTAAAAPATAAAPAVSKARREVR